MVIINYIAGDGNINNYLLISVRSEGANDEWRCCGKFANLSALQLPMTLLRTAAYVNLICRFTCNAGANDVVADGGR